MYVPPDEPVQELGEVNMTFQADERHRGRMEHMHTEPNYPPTNRSSATESATGDHEAGYGVNPIYQR